MGVGTHPLEDLLPSNILQAGIQITDALGDVDELGLVGRLDLGGADGQVQRQPDAAVGLHRRQPPRPPAAAARREADPVLARVCCCEGESP